MNRPGYTLWFLVYTLPYIKIAWIKVFINVCMRLFQLSKVTVASMDI